MSNTAGSIARASGDVAIEALEIEHLSKAFGATQALDDVGFAVRSGSIHGLLGGNGSGKSTLIKILAGVQRGDAGGTIARGDTVLAADHVTPDSARELGLRFVHQNPAVFPTMTVADNIALGSAAGYEVAWGAVRRKRLYRTTAELLERFDIHARPEQQLDELRPADQMMVAIARALADSGPGSSRLLVLDEPTASLPHHEVDVLLSALRRCIDDGQTILYVSHRLEEVMDLVDAVTILRDGKHVVTRDREGLDKASLIEYITGRRVDASRGSRESIEIGEPVFRASGLRGGVLENVDLSVAAGEIVGIAGLLGSGRSEVLRAAFGAFDLDDGHMELEGRPYSPRTPAAAMASGVAYVPEDRGVDAAFSDLSVSDNLAVARISEFSAGPRVQGRREASESARIITQLGIKTDGPAALMSSLSGGNQQKVILGRWLARNPRLLLLDEPTQGVDIGARTELYAAVRTAVDEGMAAVVVASDFEELAAVADRVLVLRAGRIVAQLSGVELTAHRITDAVYAEELA